MAAQRSETTNPLREEPVDATEVTFETEAHTTQTPVSHWKTAVQKISGARAFSDQLNSKREAVRDLLASGDHENDSFSSAASSSWSPRHLTENGVPAVVHCAAEGLVSDLKRLLLMMPTEPEQQTLAEELDSLVIVDGDDKGQNALIKAVSRDEQLSVVSGVSHAAVRCATGR